MNNDTVDFFNRGLFDFIAASPTPFHAVANLETALKAGGFSEVKESESWQLEPGEGYFLKRNNSSVIAWWQGEQADWREGLRIVGAHTDSPTLMLKPMPDLPSQPYRQLGVQVYGGALLNPWFDRDLSLAGRVSYRSQGRVDSLLVDFSVPIAVIPSLAIHLDREANQNRSINSQTDIVPILGLQDGNSSQDFRLLLAEQVRREHPSVLLEEVLDFELSFYDTQPPQLIGLQREFIASARLDNLLSCYVGLRALLASDRKHNVMLVCTDHEEVGSASYCGAQGPMLDSLLTRITRGDIELRAAMLDQSLLVSADNAHGVHPNFRSRHDDQHGPILNGGPVIKINANQRYASNSETAARFRHLASLEDVPVQSFVVRSDMACGSTIGPITAANVGVKTVDVGVPTFAMHSIRELAGAADGYSLYRVLRRFYAGA